jgi:multiple sugar transport system permease protein
VLAVWLLFSLFPIYWMVTTSFKTHLQVYNGPFYAPGVDFQPYLGAWQYILGGELSGTVFHGIANSLLYATVGALCAVAVGALAGYGLARYRYRYGLVRNDDLSFLYLSQRVMPPIVAVLALFVMYKLVHLLDTQLGMILLYTWFNIPITTYLLKDFFASIPRELEHAAAVDGYGKLQQMTKVVVPLAAPGLAAAFLLSFFFAWNDFLFALILTFQNAQTLPLVITGLNQRMEPEWGFVSVLGIIAIVPPVIATLILDRILKRGGLFTRVR